jgi:hypothetical protein
MSRDNYLSARVSSLTSGLGRAKVALARQVSDMKVRPSQPFPPPPCRAPSLPILTGPAPNLRRQPAPPPLPPLSPPPDRYDSLSWRRTLARQEPRANPAPTANRGSLAAAASRARVDHVVPQAIKARAEGMGATACRGAWGREVTWASRDLRCVPPHLPKHPKQPPPPAPRPTLESQKHPLTRQGPRGSAGLDKPHVLIKTQSLQNLRPISDPTSPLTPHPPPPTPEPPTHPHTPGPARRRRNRRGPGTARTSGSPGHRKNRPNGIARTRRAARCAGTSGSDGTGGRPGSWAVGVDGPGGSGGGFRCARGRRAARTSGCAWGVRGVGVYLWEEEVDISKEME